MKVSALFALGAATLLATSATTAFAQMNSAEILQRLKKQAGNVNTMQVDSGSTQRGITLNYGTPPPTPSEEAAPSVVAVPATAAPPPAAAPAPSYVSIDSAPTVQPVREIGTSVAIAPAPSPVYTIEETASAPQTVSIEDMPAPAVATTVAATPAEPRTIAPRQVAAPVPSYTYSNAAPAATAVQRPAQPVLASTAPPRNPETEYTAVDQDARVDLRIYFEWNSAALRPEAIGQLAELCTAIHSMSAEGANRFKIIGHTDKSGTAEYNLYLSRARAREVKRHLIEECALPERSLIATGEGERQSSPSTPSQAPEERRVEVQLVS